MSSPGLSPYAVSVLQETIVGSLVELVVGPAVVADLLILAFTAETILNLAILAIGAGIALELLINLGVPVHESGHAVAAEPVSYPLERR
jgi:hypothetical protein